MCNTKRSYTQAERMVMRNFKSKSRNVCGYCGKHVADSNKTIDHKIPYSRGGKTTSNNLIVACECCNKDKADMTKSEYMEYLKIKYSKINGNKTLRTIKELIEYNENIAIDNMNTMRLLQETTLKRKDIEKCIEDMNFNASEGYKLCKELKDAMVKIKELKAKGSHLVELITTVQQDNIILNNTFKELTHNIMKDVRTEMKIGHISKLELVS